jgi:hypothetical protein
VKYRAFPVRPELGELIHSNDDKWHTTDFYINYPEHKRRRCTARRCPNRCILIRAWEHHTSGWCGDHMPDVFAEMFAEQLDEYVARWWYQHYLDICPVDRVALSRRGVV